MPLADAGCAVGPQASHRMHLHNVGERGVALRRLADARERTLPRLLTACATGIKLPKTNVPPRVSAQSLARNAANGFHGFAKTVKTVKNGQKTDKKRTENRKKPLKHNGTTPQRRTNGFG